jgi:DNA-binding response OmpR family regulator
MVETAVRKMMETAAKSPEAARVLVVEDEPDIAALIAYQLTREGFRVETAASGTDALDAVHRELPDLLVLDRMLPGLSGDDVLKTLKGEPGTSAVPVLVLTARREQEERIEGFELGADDYLTKPFGLRELLSRIRTLLRRAYGDLADAAGGRMIRHGDLVIDLERRRVQRGGRRISLTPTEFEILRHLASKPGRVYTRSELLELLRDYEALDQDEKTINVHVSHLRDKIEDDPTSPAFVQTVRGVGYAFAER